MEKTDELEDVLSDFKELISSFLKEPDKFTIWADPKGNFVKVWARVTTLDMPVIIGRDHTTITCLDNLMKLKMFYMDMQSKLQTDLPIPSPPKFTPFKQNPDWHPQKLYDALQPLYRMFKDIPQVDFGKLNVATKPGGTEVHQEINGEHTLTLQESIAPIIKNICIKQGQRITYVEKNIPA